jgi:protein-tyrosine phosphatase
MKGLYDIHCHILPGVDDGARNTEESLWMLNKEYNEGVRHVILTPHFRYDMFEPHLNIVTRQFMQLRRAAMNIGEEGMRLYLGCELHSSMDMVECLKKGRRLTMAGSRYVLVEFSNGDEKKYIEERVRSLLMNGYIPIIAHVERYKATRNDIGFLTELKQMGAYIQVNADTISGQDGFGARTFAKKVMKQGLLDFVGSDGHRKTERIPEIGKCVAKMEKTMGSEYVKKMFPFRLSPNRMPECRRSMIRAMLFTV